MQPMQPPAVLLQGAPGSGKTDVIPTFIEAGLETFVVSTEPGGIESLLDSCARRKLDVSKLHWATVLPAATNWSALRDMVTTIGTMGFDQIQNIKAGVGKAETRKPVEKLLNTLANFVCERDGKTYGDMASWGPDRAFCLDSLSGLSLMSMALTIGYKPAAHQGEWGVAMNFIEQLLLKLTSDRRCFFALTAHVEKEQNEITGVNQVMPSTIGRKLAPKIPRFFSEHVYTKRTLDAQKKPTFIWSTVDSTADLKSRALPMGEALVPSFVPVVEAYRRRVQEAGGSPQPSLAPVAQPAPTLPAAGLTQVKR